MVCPDCTLAGSYDHLITGILLSAVVCQDQFEVHGSLAPDSTFFSSLGGSEDINLSPALWQLSILNHFTKMTPSWPATPPAILSLPWDVFHLSQELF